MIKASAHHFHFTQRSQRINAEHAKVFLSAVTVSVSLELVLFRSAPHIMQRLKSHRAMPGTSSIGATHRLRKVVTCAIPTSNAIHC